MLSISANSAAASRSISRSRQSAKAEQNWMDCFKFSMSRSRVIRCRRMPSPTVWVPLCIFLISSRGTPSFRSSLIRRRISASSSL